MSKGKPFKETKLGSWLKDKAPKVLGVIGDVLPDKGVLGIVKNLIDNDPEIPAEQKLEFERMMQDHEREMYTLQIQDTDSARDMQIEALKQHDQFSKRYVYYFSTFWSLFAAVYLAGITFFAIPKDNIRVVDTVLGFLLGTAIAMMFSYFYGASLPKEVMKFGGFTKK